MKLQPMDTMGNTELLLWPKCHREGDPGATTQVMVLRPCGSAWLGTAIREMHQQSKQSSCACRNTTISPGMSAAGGISAKKCVLDARDRSE